MTNALRLAGRQRVLTTPIMEGSKMANPRICSVEDCNKPHKAKGLCNAHYQRLITHGDPLGGGTPIGEPLKFYNDVVLPYEGKDCLIWPFSRNTNGYGHVLADGHTRYIHRLVCEDVNGPPPTPKHQAAHECGNGHHGCVNKHHLSWKTPKENQADKLTHGTHNRGERQWQAKLTEADVREILSLRGKVHRRETALRFKVSLSTIAKIHAGINWASVEPADVPGTGCRR